MYIYGKEERTSGFPQKMIKIKKILEITGNLIWLNLKCSKIE